MLNLSKCKLKLDELDYSHHKVALLLDNSRVLHYKLEPQAVLSLTKLQSKDNTKKKNCNGYYIIVIILFHKYYK